MTGPYTRIPTTGNVRANDGSATDARVIVNALSGGLEALEASPVQAWPTVMASPPTVTVSADGAATGISNSARVKANNAAFLYVGSDQGDAGVIGAFTDGNVKQIHSTINYGLLRPVFETNAPTIEAIVRVTHATESSFRWLVDGQYVAEDPTALATVGSVRRISLPLGSARNRQIIFEGQFVELIGFQKGAKYAIWPPDVVLGDRVGVAGDSWLSGGSSTDDVTWATAEPAFMWNSFAFGLHYTFGWNVFIIPGPATGYNESPVDPVNLPPLKDRVTEDITDLNLDGFIGTGGLNDRGGVMGDVEDGINVTFDQIATENPNMWAMVCGPEKPLDGVSAFATLPTISGYLATAAAAHDYTFIDTTDWVTGTGYLGAENNSGPSDVFCSGDKLHLTPEGFAYWRRRFVAEVRAALRAA